MNPSIQHGPKYKELKDPYTGKREELNSSCSARKCAAQQRKRHSEVHTWKGRELSLVDAEPTVGESVLRENENCLENETYPPAPRGSSTKRLAFKWAYLRGK